MKKPPPPPPPPRIFSKLMTPVNKDHVYFIPKMVFVYRFHCIPLLTDFLPYPQREIVFDNFALSSHLKLSSKCPKFSNLSPPTVSYSPIYEYSGHTAIKYRRFVQANISTPGLIQTDAILTYIRMWTAICINHRPVTHKWHTCAARVCKQG